MAARHQNRPFAATLLAAGLTLTGCGLLGEEGDPPTPPPTDAEPADPNGDDTPEPEGFPEDLSRFEPGDVIDVGQGEDRWEGVLTVSEQTFVTLDARQPEDSLDGRRVIEVTDAWGELVSESVSTVRDNAAINLGGGSGDPIIYLDLGPGEYLVAAPTTGDGEATEFVLNAYAPPVIEVGDTVEVEVPPARQLMEEPLGDGMVFGIRLPEDGVYRFESSSDELPTTISLFSSPDQEHWSDFVVNDTRGLLETELAAGSYTVVVVNSDADSGSASLQVSGG